MTTKHFKHGWNTYGVHIQVKKNSMEKIDFTSSGFDSRGNTAFL